MPLELSEVSTKAAFHRVVLLEHLAYHTPFNAFWEILKGPSVEECATRQWAWHEETKGSHWLQVKDTETDEVVGAAEWVIHESDPFANPEPPLRADWWPDGNLRDIANQMITTFMSGKPHRINRPHLFIGYCFVSPFCRRRGAGRLLLDWGCKKADTRGLEAFVESTDDGLALYQAFGFRIVDSVILDPCTENPSKEWKAAKGKVVPEPYQVWIMWRPKGGKWVEGETRYSWLGERK